MDVTMSDSGRKQDKRKSTATGCFKQFDQYGEPMLFNFNGGSTTYQSKWGSFLHLLVVAMTIVFTF